MHTTQLMPLPLTVSCFSKIQIVLPFRYWLTWVVPEKGPLNGCVCEGKCKWSYGSSCPMDFPLNIFIYSFMQIACAVKRPVKRRQRAPRPASPYSTDSNYSAILAAAPHKPYPKSQRRRQIAAAGRQARQLHGRHGNPVSTAMSPALRPLLRELCCHLVCFAAAAAAAANTHTKGKGSPYSITERRAPELIPVLGSQPAGDVNHKPNSRLPLLSTRPAVTPATLKRAATNFAAW